MPVDDQTSRDTAPRPRGALALGLVIVLLSTGLGFGYLAAVEIPRRAAEQTRQLASAIAEQKRVSVYDFLARTRGQLTAAATSPLVMRAANDSSPANIELAETALKPLFPTAVNLRVLVLDELGTAALSRGEQGLNNHIEIDLVRRTNALESTGPEAYRLDEKSLTSMAQPAINTQKPDERAVILLTFDSSTQFDYFLSEPKGAGKTVLQQMYTDSSGGERTLVIASAGSANDQGEPYRQYAELEDIPWRIAFTPGPALLNRVSVDRAPLYAAAALGIIGATVGALLAAGSLRRRPRPRATPTAHEADSAEQPAAAPAASDSDAEPLPPNRPHGEPDLMETAEELELDLDESAETAEQGELEIADHVFRAYDIRGNAETELNDALIKRIGRVLGDTVAERGEHQMIVASDGRLSSPRIRSQLISSLLEAGIDVIDIGLVPTPLLHFATHHLEARSGVVVTGSHNPAEDNGLKIVLGRKSITRDDIQAIRQRVLEPVDGQPGYLRGHVVKQDIVPAYIEAVAADIALAAPARVVIDAGNGATGEVAPRLFRALGCDVVPLFCDIDGHFPNHSPDTSDERNLEALSAAVQAEQADFGVAFDGDGDRLAVVAGSGRTLRADTLLMVFAQDIVLRHPGADVVFDVKCSRHLARLVTQLGGRPVLWKTGHAFMKQKIAETGAPLGGEFSGHIFIGERWYGNDDGLYAAARLAELLSSQDQSLDEALDALPQTISTGEMRIPVAEGDKFALMEKITSETDFGTAKVNTLDGIRVDFDSGWGLLRASNTSAALTARFEADSEEQLAGIQRAFREQVGRIEPGLELPF